MSVKISIKTTVAFDLLCVQDFVCNVRKCGLYIFTYVSNVLKYFYNTKSQNFYTS